MNRKEEYEALLAGLEATPGALEYTVTRAKARRRRRQWLLRPVIALTGLFAAFVLLVNVSAPVACAVSLVPGLDKLAAAVTFSRSLSAAVENDFVQSVDQEQTVNGVTVHITHLIVDRKQIHIFYMLDAKDYAWVSASPRVTPVEGGRFDGGLSVAADGNEEALRRITVDFIDAQVPESLKLTMEIYGRSETVQPREASVEADMFAAPEERAAEPEENRIAEMEFILSFDPDYTAQARTVELNETVLLDDGQFLTITTLEIYPTHMRINVEADLANSAWLKRLDFYIENSLGTRFEIVSDGITATGRQIEELDPGSQMMTFRADSPWFYEARHLKLVIIGAQWLDKDRERVRLDLETGKADWMPQGTELYSLEQGEEGWIVTVLARLKEDNGPMYNVFTTPWYDEQGVSHDITSWRGTAAYDEEGNPMKEYFLESFALTNCAESVVWLEPTFSRCWTAKDPITVTIR